MEKKEKNFTKREICAKIRENTEDRSGILRKLRRNKEDVSHGSGTDFGRER